MWPHGAAEADPLKVPVDVYYRGKGGAGGRIVAHTYSVE
jgi:hypothetical protein